MKVLDVGERRLIQMAKKIFNSRKWVEVGIGDDSAVLRVGRKRIVLTTDMLIEGIHFLPGATPEHIARKSVVATLSDLAAMGANPLSLLFSVALPRGTGLSFVRRMMKEMNRVAMEYSAPVVGGDLSEGGRITIAGTGVGEVTKHLLKRSGARPGDLVAVTGALGKASAGLMILRRNFPQSRFKGLVKAQLEPACRVREGRAIGGIEGVTAAIDISDGFAMNLSQLAEESGVKVVIEGEAIPADPLVLEFSEKYNLDPSEFILYGGEDFELIFTFQKKAEKKVVREFKRLGSRVTVVGRVAEGRGIFLRRDGKIERLPSRGFEHFVR